MSRTGMQNRRKSALYIEPGMSIRVEVFASFENGVYTPAERDAMMTDQLDRAMRSLNEGRHVNAPLSKIKIR